MAELTFATEHAPTGTIAYLSESGLHVWRAGKEVARFAATFASASPDGRVLLDGERVIELAGGFPQKPRQLVYRDGLAGVHPALHADGDRLIAFDPGMRILDMAAIDRMSAGVLPIEGHPDGDVEGVIQVRWDGEVPCPAKGRISFRGTEGGRRSLHAGKLDRPTFIGSLRAARRPKGRRVDYAPARFRVLLARDGKHWALLDDDRFAIGCADVLLSYVTWHDGTETPDEEKFDLPPHATFDEERGRLVYAGKPGVFAFDFQGNLVASAAGIPAIGPAVAWRGGWAVPEAFGYATRIRLLGGADLSDRGPLDDEVMRGAERLTLLADARGGLWCASPDGELRSLARGDGEAPPVVTTSSADEESGTASVEELPKLSRHALTKLVARGPEATLVARGAPDEVVRALAARIEEQLPVLEESAVVLLCEARTEAALEELARLARSAKGVRAIAVKHSIDVPKKGPARLRHRLDAWVVVARPGRARRGLSWSGPVPGAGWTCAAAPVPLLHVPEGAIDGAPPFDVTFVLSGCEECDEWMLGPIRRAGSTEIEGTIPKERRPRRRCGGGAEAPPAAPAGRPVAILERELAPDERPLARLFGLPRWVQAPEVPLCPGCRAPAFFLGQVNGSVRDLTDTEVYLFVCESCALGLQVHQTT